MTVWKSKIFVPHLLILMISLIVSLKAKIFHIVPPGVFNWGFKYDYCEVNERIKKRYKIYATVIGGVEVEVH